MRTHPRAPFASKIVVSSNTPHVTETSKGPHRSTGTSNDAEPAPFFFARTEA